jgi:hypothetical protein
MMKYTLEEMASIIEKQPKSYIKRMLNKVRKASEKVDPEVGYKERKITVPIDPIGKAAPIETEEDKKIRKFHEIKDKILALEEANPELEKEIEQKVIAAKQPKPRQIKYAAKNNATREAALVVLRNIQQIPDTQGNIPKLTAFEREVIAELKLAEEAGIEIPFNFPGSKDKKLLKLRLELEDNSEEIEDLIDQMSLEEYSVFVRKAQTFLKEIEKKGE